MANKVSESWLVDKRLANLAKANEGKDGGRQKITLKMEWKQKFMHCTLSPVLMKIYKIRSDERSRTK